MLSAILFETRFGEWVLAQLEKRAGLAVVKAGWLGEQQISPATVDGQLAGPNGHDREVTIPELSVTQRELLDNTSAYWKISDALDIGLAEELPVLDLSPRRLFEELEGRGYRYDGGRWVLSPGEAKEKQ
jgi:hypothetical protein